MEMTLKLAKNLKAKKNKTKVCNLIETSKTKLPTKNADI